MAIKFILCGNRTSGDHTSGDRTSGGPPVLGASDNWLMSHSTQGSSALY